MIVYLLTAAATVALAAGVKRQERVLLYTGGGYREVSRQQMLNRVAIIAIFIILFGIEAGRMNVGNDYAKYVEFMHLVVSNAYVPTEFGFNLVVRLLYGISGFENFLLVFAFFSFATIAFFLSAIYRQSTRFWFSFFLFMAFGYYFQSFSTVRYYLALALAVFAVPYVLRREWIKFILLILAGAAFHKSLLVVIPLYFLASLKWNKWSLGLAACFCTTFFFLQDFYLRVVVFLYPTYADTEYLEGGTSYTNILRCAGVLVFSLIYYRQAVKEERENRFYFYCNLGALVLYVCCSFIPIISRIGHYLMVMHILFVPAVLGKISDKKQRRFFTVVILGAGVLYFAMYLLKARADGVRLFPYQSFLFHDMPLKLSDVN